MTPFKKIYDSFFVLITDDTYVEMRPEEVAADCEELLISSLPLFEFPKYELEYENHSFLPNLTQEEINILAQGMVLRWLDRQISTIELTRQKFSGSDFRLTSQASHLQKLILWKKELAAQNRHLQRIYDGRRKAAQGGFESTWDAWGSKK